LPAGLRRVLIILLLASKHAQRQHWSVISGQQMARGLLSGTFNAEHQQCRTAGARRI